VSVTGSQRQCDYASPLTPAQQTACANLLNSANAKVDETLRLRTAGWVMTGVGGVVVVTGVVLLVTGADPHPKDEKPAGPVLGGWLLAPEVGAGHVFLGASRAF
jgi:hypothetical protein